jgi:phosphocarrier protein
MNPDGPCILSRQTVVVNEMGIHARSAAKIAELAQNAEDSVWIAGNNDQVDATSIIDILTLGCAKGTVITVSVRSNGDRGILDDIIRLVEDGFGE